MATIFTTGKLDGTTVNSELTITVKSRGVSTVTFSYKIITYLNASGQTGVGYEEYTGTIKISGTDIETTTKTVTLKGLNEAWSGSTNHTKEGTFTVDTDTYTDLTAKVTYTVKSSKDSVNSNSGSTTLPTGSGAVIPTSPTTFTAKSYDSSSGTYFYIGYNADSYINLSASGGSNVSSYEYAVSINGGTYSKCNIKYYPPTKTKGTKYKFRVRAVSSTGNTSGWVYSSEIIVGYRASTPPTGLTAKTDKSVSTSKFYIGYNADTSITLTASGGTNISSYKYQVKKNSGTWTDCSAVYKPTGLKAGDKLSFRVCIIGLSGNTTTYFVSDISILILYYTPSKPTNISFKEEEYYPHKGTINILWEKPPETVSGYKIQYSISGGDWVSLPDIDKTSLECKQINLKFTQEIVFRIAAYNSSGQSSYAKSSPLLCVGGLYLIINKSPKPCDVYLKQNGQYKRLTVYVNVGGVPKVTL